MQRLCYRIQPLSLTDEVLPGIRLFFERVRRIERTLGKDPYLNRVQRARCRRNLGLLRELEREFHAIDHSSDFRELHRSLRRYIGLDRRDLAYVLGREELQIRRFSLFLPR